MMAPPTELLLVAGSVGKEKYAEIGLGDRFARDPLI
jgi:hypothetical protein